MRLDADIAWTTATFGPIDARVAKRRKSKPGHITALYVRSARVFRHTCKELD